MRRRAPRRRRRALARAGSRLLRPRTRRRPRRPARNSIVPAGSVIALGLAVRRTAAGRELDHVIGERQQAIVVRRDDHDRPGVAELAQQLQHPFDLDLVEVRGRLVGEQQRRVEARARGRSRPVAAGRPRDRRVGACSRSPSPTPPQDLVAPRAPARAAPDHAVCQRRPSRSRARSGSG